VALVDDNLLVRVQTGVMKWLPQGVVSMWENLPKLHFTVLIRRAHSGVQGTFHEVLSCTESVHNVKTRGRVSRTLLLCGDLQVSRGNF